MGGSVRSAVRLLGVVLRASKLYLRVRLMLWRWRRAQKKRFRKRVRGLPRQLALELEEAYEEKIEVFHLPGLREIVSGLRRGSSEG